MAYDLRTTPENNSQRILNAMEPGTVLPIHRHRVSTETVVILQGWDDNKWEHPVIEEKIRPDRVVMTLSLEAMSADINRHQPTTNGQQPTTN